MDGEVAKAAEEVLWWLGWHRLRVVVGAMSLTLLVGYIISGSVGLGVLVIGSFLIFLASLSRAFLVLEVVCLTVTAGILYLFGGQGFLETVGVSSEDAEFVAELILDLSGSIGFVVDYPVGQAVPTVGKALAGLSGSLLVGFAVGLAVWSLGAAVVNRTYGEVHESFRVLIEKKGDALLGERTHTAMNGVGSTLGLKPYREYHASNIRVRDNSVDLNYGSVLKMPSKAVSVSGSTKHMYYDQLASVEYEEPYMEIRMADGDVVRVATSEKPVELLEEIETRLKSYKRLTTPPEEETLGTPGSVGEPDTRTEVDTETEGWEETGTESEAQKTETTKTEVEAEEEPEEPEIAEESRAKAEEAVEDIEEVVESALDEMGDTLNVMDDQEEMDVEEEQVEVEGGD